jgi:hypothetical protein
MAEKKIGNQHGLGNTFKWIYSPKLDKEFAYKGEGIPPGFVKGRSPDIKEMSKYIYEKYKFKSKVSTNLPTKRQSMMDL